MWEIGLLIFGTLAFAEGCASEWRGRKTRAKILIIGGFLIAVVAAYRINDAVSAALSLSR